MFCAYCGKPIAQDGQYCPHCGKSVAPASQISASTPIEWEFTYYRVSWASGKGGRYPLTFGRTESSVRLDNWGEDQSWILPKIQYYLDRGWVPVGEVGPGGYHFIHHEDYLEVFQFLVEFRRPATPLSASEQQLLGVWEEAKQPNAGLLGKLGNALLWQRLEIQRWQYEFFGNRTFTCVSPDGTRAIGAWISGTANEFTLQWKYSSDDYLATLQGDRLICTAKGYATREFRRRTRDGVAP